MNPVQYFTDVEAGKCYERIYQYNCNKEFVCYKLFEFRDYKNKPRRATNKKWYTGTFSSRGLVLVLSPK